MRSVCVLHPLMGTRVKSSRRYCNGACAGTTVYVRLSLTPGTNVNPSVNSADSVNSASFAAAKKDRVPLAELAAKVADRGRGRSLGRVLAAREGHHPITVSTFNSAL
ncbi:hypothetical protein GCM10010289_23230 [Streptomyces violascens]|uniref:Uncharacterized protein n=1 Tax=Streptomyces violascens TaxID=67381 RepID=A0ABQ3QIP7_9ACTN|nr:hypothetical protein GCM10010289_23230 [Streptomyces violascens]GHI37150.1 hypothetical protein Sviol_15580 [Streptomyces violascens]